MDENQRDNIKSKTTDTRRSGKETGQEDIQDIEQDINITGTTDFKHILSDSTTTKTKKRRFQKSKSIVNLSNYKAGHQYHRNHRLQTHFIRLNYHKDKEEKIPEE